MWLWSFKLNKFIWDEPQNDRKGSSFQASDYWRNAVSAPKKSKNILQKATLRLLWAAKHFPAMQKLDLLATPIKKSIESLATFTN